MRPKLKTVFVEDHWQAGKNGPTECVDAIARMEGTRPDSPLAKRFGNRMGTLWEATQPGSRLTFKFRGSTARLYDLLGPDGGQVLVTVDGVTQVQTSSSLRQLLHLSPNCHASGRSKCEFRSGSHGHRRNPPGTARPNARRIQVKGPERRVEVLEIPRDQHSHESDSGTWRCRAVVMQGGGGPQPNSRCSRG